MQTYKLQCGDTIDNIAAEMVAIANRTGDVVVSMYNNIELKTGPCKNEEVGIFLIKARYEFELRHLAETCRNSPGAKKATIEENTALGVEGNSSGQ